MSGMSWLLVLAALILAGLGATALLAHGEARWHASTRALLLRLQGTRLPPIQLRYDSAQLVGLPAPVQRYFRTVLRDGQAIILSASVEQVGTFNLHPSTNKWKPFTAVQWVQTRRPGFIWDARIRIAAGISVFVHDAYLDGGGVLNPAVLGLFSLAGEVDEGALAEGEFVRFFAEAAWYPTALLPSQGVRWTEVDDRSARATLADGRISTTMLVRFDAAGLIESVCVEARPAMVGNRFVATPWEGRWSNYYEQDGMLIPRATLTALSIADVLFADDVPQARMYTYIPL